VRNKARTGTGATQLTGVMSSGAVKMKRGWLVLVVELDAHHMLRIEYRTDLHAGVDNWPIDKRKEASHICSCLTHAHPTHAHTYIPLFQRGNLNLRIHPPRFIPISSLLEARVRLFKCLLCTYHLLYPYRLSNRET